MTRSPRLALGHVALSLSVRDWSLPSEPNASRAAVPLRSTLSRLRERVSHRRCLSSQLRSRAAEGVRTFHAFFGFPTREKPQVIEGDELALRKTLLEEEHAELQEALDEGDLEAIAKEAADLLYVLYGLQWHIGIDFDAAFDIVQESNMTKLWSCEKCEGEGSLMKVREYSPPICPVCEGAARVPKYREDGKLLKPPTYEKPDMSEVV